ncbi:hypothetical protein ALNOE001_04030 [Candidatus Methanobinarius endosymbioticus]|uniref:Uncharacterized protein n=1 Tax=Candidatus Methanobinarius endosymbioticus TaxID=2006182 RepID=A0A366MD47_9EURY|nr:hypothetical protein ALNOE001_04030 [Candidatus Methanobinarius endosymbioticus]
MNFFIKIDIIGFIYYIKIKLAVIVDIMIFDWLKYLKKEGMDEKEF